MRDLDDAEAAHRPRRRWERWVFAAAVCTALMLRAALPSVLRATLVGQVKTNITGRLAVGDVDLSLSKGVVVLEDVALRTEGATDTEDPLIGCRRLWVDLGWFALLRGTVQIQDLGLEGLRLRLDRLADGEILLPRMREGTATDDGRAAERVPEPSEAGKARWAVVIDRASFLQGKAVIRDSVAQPPASREIALPELQLRDLRLQPTAGVAPGRVALRIGVGDGEIGVRTKIQAVAAGFDVGARIRMINVPLDQLHVHAPQLGWSGSRGRLDGVLHSRLRAGGALTAGGQIALRDLEIRVPNEEEPALAVRRLEASVPHVNVTGRHAQVRRVAIDGLRVLVRPREEVALPLLPSAHPGNAAEEAAVQTGEAATPVAKSKAGDVAEPTVTWDWRVGKLEMTDAVATVFLEPPPLAIAIVSGEVTGLSSEPGAQASVTLDLEEGDGRLGLEGAMTFNPPRGELTLRPKALSLARLATASGAVPVTLAGTLDGEVTVVAREDPVVARGALALSGFEAKQVRDEDFSVGWNRLDVDIREVRLGGVLQGEAASGPRRIEADLGLVKLAQPQATITRTPTGVVLPGTSADEKEHAEQSAGAPLPRQATAAGTAPDSGPGELSLRAERFVVHNGTLRVVDQAVEPVYRGTVRAMQIDAADIRFPEDTVRRLEIDMKAPGGAPLTVTSVQRGEQVRVEGSIESLPLAQFNAYAAPSGYRVESGTLDLRSEIDWKAPHYTSENRLSVDGLVVGGSEGEALFRKRFGVPLQMALALLKDVNGRVSLGVPVSGDRERGARITLGTIVVEALTRALVGALTSPLKLLGAVTMSGTRIEEFAPEPIAFVPGRTEPSGDSQAQLERMATALGVMPGLAVTLRGMAGATDARGLAEAAVLADLESENGVLSEVRNLFRGGLRDDISEALTARARGERGELEADEQEQLDRWVAGKTITDAELLALADGRAERVRRFLVEEHGVPAGQVVVAEPRVSRAGGSAAVDVGIGAEGAAVD
jgi:hypothetical protein